MMAHLRYLRYVLLHKWYVLRAGVVIGGLGPTWLWRLLIHDLSKFRPSEWRPYVAKFYGANPKGRDETVRRMETRVNHAFDRAWLAHIHRNTHHWQHWMLHEDSGKTLVLLMDARTADEMLADWIGAGTKILGRPSLAECVAETVVWYGTNYAKMQMRAVTRAHVEGTLLGLCERFGIAKSPVTATGTLTIEL